MTANIWHHTIDQLVGANEVGMLTIPSSRWIRPCRSICTSNRSRLLQQRNRCQFRLLLYFFGNKSLPVSSPWITHVVSSPDIEPSGAYLTLHQKNQWTFRVGQKQNQVGRDLETKVRSIFQAEQNLGHQYIHVKQKLITVIFLQPSSAPRAPCRHFLHLHVYISSLTPN